MNPQQPNPQQPFPGYYDPNQMNPQQQAPPQQFNPQMNPSAYQQPLYDPSYYQFYYAYYAALQNAAKHSASQIPPGIEPTTCKSLYIGNLHEKVSEALLYDIFAMVGAIDSCKLIKDKNTGASAGYGFIDYFEHHTAAIALQQFSGKLLYGLEIKVNWAFANTAKEDTAQHHHIFVGDLSPEVDDKALNAAFAVFGTVTEARVMWDTATNRSRGYGFVAFRRKDEAQRALTEMNGELLGSRPIRCNWANQKGLPGADFPWMQSSQPMISAPARPSMPVHNSGLDFATVTAQAGPSNTTVYVGGVAPEVSEHMLRQIFIEYGVVEEIKLQADKGFAFVRFANHDSCARAIVGTHGRMVGSRAIKCSWGKEKMGTLMANPPPMIAQPSSDYYGPRRY